MKGQAVISRDLHRFARMNLPKELEAAIRGGVDVNAKDQFGSTALHYAIVEKHVGIVSLLLANGADPAAQDGDGKTPLHYAIEYNLPSVAEDLLEHDQTIVSIADKFGNEPLWSAAFNSRGNYDLVNLLLRYGADPRHRNHSNLTPLDIPKRKRDDALLRLLQSR